MNKSILESLQEIKAAGAAAVCARHFVEALGKVLAEYGPARPCQVRVGEFQLGNHDTASEVFLLYGRPKDGGGMQICGYARAVGSDDKIGKKAGVPWLSCSRELQLVTFVKLPELLTAIGEQASQFAADVRESVAASEGILEGDLTDQLRAMLPVECE